MRKFLLTALLTFSTLIVSASTDTRQLSASLNVDLVSANNAASRFRAVAEGNRDGKKKAAVTDNWQKIGSGSYTDILFSELYGLPAQNFAVEFEQNIDDPTIYRIPEVYANMDFSAYSGLIYDPSNVSPMIIHVYRDEYAYFEEFDTGVYSSYSSNGTDYSGEIRMLMQGADLLAFNELATLATYLPESLCLYQNGNLTLEPTFTLEGRTLSNILGLCYVTGTPYDQLFRGNTKGDFMITLPDAEDYDPDADWRDIGNAIYTDTFTEGLYSANPEFGSWEVRMQQNRFDSYLYRLVNPYKNWKSPSADITYDASRNYYMMLIIHRYDGFSLVGIPTFYTGLEIDGKGAYAVSNQAADVLKEYDFLTLYYNFNGCLGYMKDDGVITYSSHCLIDYEYYFNFFGYCGFDHTDTFFSANSQGNFKLVMPDASDNNVESAIEDDVNSVEYFNLQGMRISNPSKGELIIEKKGKQTKKIIF